MSRIGFSLDLVESTTSPVSLDIEKVEEIIDQALAVAKSDSQKEMGDLVAELYEIFVSLGLLTDKEV